VRGDEKRRKEQAVTSEVNASVDDDVM